MFAAIMDWGKARLEPPEVKLERRIYKLWLLLLLRKGAETSQHLESYLDRLGKPSQSEQKRMEYLAMADNPNKERIDQIIRKTLKDMKWELDYVNDGHTLNTDLRRRHKGFQALLEYNLKDMSEDGSALEDEELQKFADQVLMYLGDPSGEKGEKQRKEMLQEELQRHAQQVLENLSEVELLFGADKSMVLFLVGQNCRNQSDLVAQREDDAKSLTNSICELLHHMWSILRESPDILTDGKLRKDDLRKLYESINQEGLKPKEVREVMNKVKGI